MNSSSTLVVIPTPEEVEAFLGSFRARGFQALPTLIGKLQCNAIQSLGILIAPGGHGKAQLALQTQYVIDRVPNIERVICAGAAGRLDNDLRLGDVIVSTHTIEHDYKTRFNPKPSPRHLSDAQLVDRFRRTSETNPFSFKVYFGTIASGDEDVVDRIRAEELRRECDAHCVAWEGAGASRAAAFNDLPFVEVRVVTDGADPDTPSHYAENLHHVMTNVVDLLSNTFCSKLTIHDTGSVLNLCC